MRNISSASFVGFAILMTFSCVRSGDGQQLESASNSINGTTKKRTRLKPSAICSLPLADGNCDGYFPSWAYDAEKNACVRFVYGGCGGNENRFESKEECQKVTRNCRKAR